MTLIEILTASAIAVVVLLAFSGVDMGRVFLTSAVRSDAGFQTEAGYALSHILRQLEGTDRINFVSGADDNIQFRVPDISSGGSLDAASTYHWFQYRYDSGANRILFYSDTQIPANCAASAAYALAVNITGFTVAHSDESRPPPGGETGVLDTNVLEVAISSEDPQTQNTLTLRGGVTLRSMAYTNVSTGLTAAGVSPPPAPACGA